MRDFGFRSSSLNIIAKRKGDNAPFDFELVKDVDNLVGENSVIASAGKDVLIFFGQRGSWVIFFRIFPWFAKKIFTSRC